MNWKQIEPWEEVFGTFNGLTFNDDVVIATIGKHVLQYPRRTAEAEFLIRNFRKRKTGKKVVIMNIETEFRLWWPDELKRSKDPNPFWKWYHRTYGVLDGGKL